MDLNDYLKALRNHWFGSLLILAGCAIAAFGLSSTMPKVYAANANGFVSTGTTTDLALGSVSDSLAKSRATSYVDIATSRATAQGVVDDLGLKTNPAGLVGQISVAQPEDTVLLKITARASTPKLAQQIADAWVRSLANEVTKIEAPDGKLKDGTPRVIPVEQAALPTSPISPNTSRNTLLGGALGLVLALAYSAIRSNLDKRLRFATDVQERFQVPVVGEIPVTPLFRPGDTAGRRTTEDPRTAEAFRKLRTNLMYMDVDAPPRVFVITSPRPGDGKSTIASNIAMTLENMGEQVVLIDADLRRPTQAKKFQLDDAIGLTSVLTGQLDLEEALQDVPGAPRLRVLTSGPLPPNPSELLGTHAWRRLVDGLRERSYVVIDAPPLLPVTDAAVAARNADGAFVVVNARNTVEDDLSRSLQALDAVNARMLGTVINRMAKRSNRYAYDGYGYGYFGAASRRGRRTSKSDGGRRRG
ncbi:polysaccharide biosynthesis tyrosine autokinase [Nocardioides jejuensis]|uniref:polysaccharide biosynthesis tyrosine autokinase n=1 Tax=Nocardioides jejuensis TaxID=2502782 RepID=UPI0014051636|nr:polysaccharide biosynthesis tyrosine autokinase [Nocardioides jejuensis]